MEDEGTVVKLTSPVIVTTGDTTTGGVSGRFPA